MKRMQELQLTVKWKFWWWSRNNDCFVLFLGAAVYKMLYSTSGRISIPRIVSIEWR